MNRYSPAPRRPDNAEPSRADLTRFSAVVIDAGCPWDDSLAARLADYFTVGVGLPEDFGADWTWPGANTEDAARWVRSLGFFPVIVLAPMADRDVVEDEGIWCCAVSDLDRLLSSRHVVPRGGIDLTGLLAPFE